MIKAVIFDFDHTLYNRDASYTKMLAPFKEELFDYLNHDLDDGELLRRMKQADKDGAYPLGWPDVYREKIKQGIFKTVPTYEVYMKCIRTHQPRSITLWDDTLDTLTALHNKGVLVGMLTNGGVQSQTDKLNNTPLAPYFDKIIISGSLPEGKPHASAYHTICRELGVLPSEAMYVGDHPINDVEGSKKAGLVAVWIPYVHPYPADRLPPDHTIEKLGELPDLVARINSEA
ncbi:MAG: HAD family hydrolase [Ruminococcaceae bacterium]|nr:HAD family hydrolase [Oscillospiraceae bacterium]